MKYFNSLPHTEVDLIILIRKHLERNFNSLPHTEVDIVFRNSTLVFIIFQLTTSHRGRQEPDGIILRRFPFQLTTSHRGRRFLLLWFCIVLVFQLTTSHRGRRISSISICRMKGNFNSLPHTEVDGHNVLFR